MKCPYCGQDGLTETAKFCKFCGEKREAVYNKEAYDEGSYGNGNPMYGDAYTSYDSYDANDSYDVDDSYDPGMDDTVDEKKRKKSAKMQNGIILLLAAILLIGAGIIGGVAIAGGRSAGTTPKEAQIEETETETEETEVQEFVITEETEAVETEAAVIDTDNDLTADQTAVDGQGEPDSGISGYEQVSMSHVKDTEGSSVLSEDAGTHWAKYICDSSLSTAWVEGADGQGIGQSVTITFDGTYVFRGFDINAGYQKSSDLYSKNSRPSQLRFDFSDGTSYTCSLEDKNGLQTVSFPDAVAADSVVVTIMDTYEGYKYSDTCISEISFY